MTNLINRQLTRKWEGKQLIIFLHSYNTIVVVAGDMEPCARVDKRRVPTL